MKPAGEPVRRAASRVRVQPQHCGGEVPLATVTPEITLNEVPQRLHLEAAHARLVPENRRGAPCRAKRCRRSATRPRRWRGP